ncbi:unnamed protein product [Parnassius mnemosyne]|uniref:Uncharacterized protein n=1 Tax=Parnassius mnemosyne TaxID=213953 RepID=A0AAV1LY24_9NEOP
MAAKVLKRIIDEIHSAKYWGLVVDSTPYISHIDQFSVIFRYYLDGHVYERFFCFLQIQSHKGRSLSNDVLDLIQEHGIDTRMLTDKDLQASSLSPADKFRVNAFYVIIDKLVAELQKRSEANDRIIQLFAFLTQLLFIEADVLEKKVANLVKAYSDDLEKDLSVELKQFIPCSKRQPKGFFLIVQEKTQVQMMKSCVP